MPVLRLEMRPQVSPVWSIASPLLALAITVVLGATLFLALGKGRRHGLGRHHRILAGSLQRQ
jgi:simple sugar transport system permease protein